MASMDLTKRRHPDFNEHLHEWTFYYESYKGGDTYRNKYLYSHRLEAQEDYVNRRSRSFYLNYCDPICTIPSDFIFQKIATRPRDAYLAPFRSNVDKKGNSMHEFMQRVGILAAVYGQMHVLLDRPRPPKDDRIEEGKTTKADSVLLQPYAVLVHPTNLLDWSINKEDKQLNWILLNEEIYEDDDFMVERAALQQYRVWTRNDWLLFDADGNQIDSEEHGLGIVPLLTYLHKDIGFDMIGESMLKDVAETNRAIFNWSSEIDEMVARQTFSQLTCPDDGSTFTEEVDDQGNSKALKRVGSSTIFNFPANASHPPRFISPDTAQIEIIWKMIDTHIREMFRMSGLISPKSSMMNVSNRTGKAQEFEFLDIAVFLASRSRNLEEMENRMNKLYYKWMQINKEPEKVQYPEKFDVISSADLVELFTKVVLNNISSRLNKEMAKRLIPQVLPYAEDSVVEEIIDEIEENKYLENPNESMGNPLGDVEDSLDKPIQKETMPNATRPERRAKWRDVNNTEE